MADSTDLKFFLTQVDLLHLVTICCDVGPSVDTYPVNVQHRLKRSINLLGAFVSSTSDASKAFRFS